MDPATEPSLDEHVDVQVDGCRSCGGAWRGDWASAASSWRIATSSACTDLAGRDGAEEQGFDVGHLDGVLPGVVPLVGAHLRVRHWEGGPDVDALGADRRRSSACDSGCRS